MPLKWWRGGIPSLGFWRSCFGWVVLFGGLFAWFSCFDVGFLCLMLSGIFGFWWEGFLLFGISAGLALWFGIVRLEIK